MRGGSCPVATIGEPAPHPESTASGSSASLAVAVPEKVVCVPVEKSAYDLGPVETRVANVPLPPIVDEAHDLDPFYARVARLVRGKAKDHVRIAVYGDSNMTMDEHHVGAMRRLLQGKFGDGGHGYVAMGRPWYRHMDVEQHLAESKWKKISTSTDQVGDGHYGHANVATESSTAGATSWVGTMDDSAPIGKSVSQIDLFFMTRPQGGSFAVKVDDEKVLDIATAAPEAAASYEHFEMPDGAHKLEVVVEGGNVRLFGAALERKTPSIIVDSLGTGALNYEQMMHVSDASRRPMLQRRKYDLVVFLIGTNLFAPGLHEKWMTKTSATSRTRESAPHPRALPPTSKPTTRTLYSDPRIVAPLEAARRHGHSWGFWDFRQAMGGDLLDAALQQGWARSSDLVHLTHDGGAIMATASRTRCSRDSTATSRLTPRRAAKGNSLCKTRSWRVHRIEAKTGQFGADELPHRGETVQHVAPKKKPKPQPRKRKGRHMQQARHAVGSHIP